MKILVISSSPRKGGNSETLCCQFATGARESGHDVEMISLRDRNISPCKACYGCMKDHVCAAKDDMAGIFSKLTAADVIVLSSPVYFYSLSAQMKTLIDRCLVNHKAIHGKQFYYIITAADPQREAAEGVLTAFRGFLRCLPDAREAGVLYGMGAWDKGDIYKHPAFEQAYEMGRKIQEE